MSLLSRIFGLGAAPGDGSSESVRRITERLEGLPPERARFVATFAYVLARIANADMRVDDQEKGEMERIVSEVSDLAGEEAALTVEIAVSRTAEVGGTENYLVTREFRRLSVKDDRVRLLRCVLAVAAADDRITSVETREIQSIGEELGLTRSEVNALRLEWRDKLAELRAT